MVKEKNRIIKVGLSDGELRPDEVLAAGFLKLYEKEILERVYGLGSGKFKFIRSHVHRTLKKCDVVLDFRHKLKENQVYKDLDSLYNDMTSVLYNTDVIHSYIREFMRESKLSHKFTIFVLWLDCPECGKKEQNRKFNLAVDYAARLLRNIMEERYYVLGPSLDDYIKLTAIETPKFLAALKAAKTKLYGYDK